MGRTEFEREGSIWVVRDLGSTNGTFVNRTHIDAPRHLRPGDRVSVGQLTMVFCEGIRPGTPAVVFVDESSAPAASTTMSASVEGLLAGENEREWAHEGAHPGGTGTRRPHAAREAVRPHSESLGGSRGRASRGVLMTLEGGELKVRATKGDGFRISSLARDLVMNQKRSLLVCDALTDQALAARMSVMEQQIRSMLGRPCRPKTEGSD